MAEKVIRQGLHVSENGTKVWYKDNLQHREDGPAVVHTNGDEEWWLNGLCHRENGPAIISANPNLTKGWYFYGVPHRIDGPAFENNFKPYWYYKGVRAEVSSQEEFEKWIKYIVFK